MFLKENKKQWRLILDHPCKNCIVFPRCMFEHKMNIGEMHNQIQSCFSKCSTVRNYIEYVEETPFDMMEKFFETICVLNQNREIKADTDHLHMYTSGDFGYIYAIYCIKHERLVEVVKNFQRCPICGGR